MLRLLGFLSVFSLATAAQAFVLTNGSFELPGGLATNGSLVLNQGDSRLVGWNIGGSGGPVNYYRNAGLLGAADGEYYISFNGGNSAPGTWVEQSIITAPGSIYHVTFAVARAGSFGEVSITASAFTTNNVELASMKAIPEVGPYQQKSLSFTANAPLTTLRFVDTSVATFATDIVLDKVAVARVSQAPTNIVLMGNIVDEEQPAGTIVGTFQANDPDLNDTHTFALVSGEGSGGNSSFAITNGVLITLAPFDYETKSNYNIRVKATDSTGNSLEKVFTVLVNNINEVPEVGFFGNGGFELPGGLPENGQLALTNGSTNLVRWSIGGTGGPLLYYRNAANYLPAHGQYYVAFNAGNLQSGTWIEQTFRTEPGATYTFLFKVGRAGFPGAMSLNARVSTSQGVQLAQLNANAESSGNSYVQKALTFTATSAASTVRFTDTSLTTVGVDLFLDEVRLMPGVVVPPTPPVVAAFTNGSFELPGGLPENGQLELTNGSPHLVRWSIGGTGGPLLYYRNAANYLPAQGQYYIAFNAGNSEPGTWVEQTFRTEPGATYTFLFKVGRAGYEGAMSLNAKVSTSEGVQLAQLNANAESSGSSYVQKALTFTATSAASTVRFTDTSSATVGVDLFLDEVRLMPGVVVPPTPPVVAAFTNGSFELPGGLPENGQLELTNGSPHLVRWSIGGTGGSLMYYRNAANYLPAQGQYYIAFNAGNSESGTWAEQTFRTEPGATYTFLFKVGRAGYEGAMSLNAKVSTSEGVQLAQLNANAESSGSSYVQKALTFTATSAASTVRFTDTSSATEGVDLFLDDVRLMPGVVVPPTPPVVAAFTNGSFELPGGLPENGQLELTNGSTHLVRWSIGGTGGSLMYYRNAANYLPAQGQYYIAFNAGNSEAGTWVEQTFRTEPGATYTFLFKVGRAGYEGAMSLNAKVSTSEGVQLAQLNANAESSRSSYVQKALTFTATSAASTVRFTDTSSATEGVDLFLDDVRLMPGVVVPPTPPVVAAFTNGSFELPGGLPEIGQMVFTNGDPRLVRWTIGGNGGPLLYYRNEANYLPADGEYYVAFNAGNTRSGTWIEQAFNTEPGATYTFSFKVGRAGYPGEMALNAKVSSSIGTQLAQLNASAGSSGNAYVEKVLTFTATTTNSTIRFTDTSSATIGVDLFLDDVRLTLEDGSDEETLGKITAQPCSTIVFAGSPIMLSVAATTVAPSYQWRKGTVAIEGATNTSLVIEHAQADAAGEYDVVVSNSAGTLVSEKALVEVFVPGPVAADDYAGLFYGSCGVVEAGKSGDFQFALHGNDHISLVYRTAGERVSSTSSGFGTNNVLVLESDGLSFTIHTGTINDVPVCFGTVAGEGWTSQLLGYARTFSEADPAPGAGTYTMVFDSSRAAIGNPQGDGVSVVRVTANGDVRINGKLGDGTPFSAATILGRNGEIPFFTRPGSYRGSGFALGWLALNTGATNPISGSVLWSRTAGKGGHTNGFTNIVSVISSKVDSNPNARLINITDGVGVAYGGNLTTPAIHDLRITDNNVVQSDPSQLVITIRRSYGLVVGRMKNPNGRNWMQVYGACLSSQNAIRGQCLGETKSSALAVIPAEQARTQSIPGVR